MNRAKRQLIESLKMAEEIAHRYIEKQAMDRCVSKKEIAEGFLKRINEADPDRICFFAAHCRVSLHDM